jgi:hypothetical protein
VLRPLESSGQLNVAALAEHVDDSAAHPACSPGDNGFHHGTTPYKALSHESTELGKREKNIWTRMNTDLLD